MTNTAVAVRQDDTEAPADLQSRPLHVLACGSTFGSQQAAAMDDVANWYRFESKVRQIYRLFGFAGTGKTTLARHLAAQISSDPGDVVFAAYTGKASLMLQRCGCEGAATIHAWIYKTIVHENGSIQFILDRSSPIAKAKLIIIDECSMVDKEIGVDLLSFGIPILVLGDPAQLPPVNSAGFFTTGRPDTMLTEIHRQARENPIVRIATDIRERRKPAYGDYGSVIVGRRGERSIEEVLDADQILVGLNATRRAYNTQIRKYKGRSSPYPAVGDKLVCLKNDPDAGIFNGGVFEVTKLLPSASPGLIRMLVRSEDFPESRPQPVSVRSEFFDGDPSKIDWRKLRGTQQFDFGYALTVHKSQGSQWGHVLAYDESGSFSEPHRWLYTAVTRAAERLTLIL